MGFQNVRQNITARYLFLINLWLLHLFNNPGDSGAISLDDNNFDAITSQNKLVFVNFYAEWCRFSNMLTPIWEEAAGKAKDEFKEGEVVFAKVDCEKESGLAQRFHISKYPTMKLIQYSKPAKKEFRGQRTAEAFIEFVKSQLDDRVTLFDTLDHVHKLEEGKKHVILYADDLQSNVASEIKKVAAHLHNDCGFLIGHGEQVAAMKPKGMDLLVYRPPYTNEQDMGEAYTGETDYESMLTWARERCMSMVREITFENAEELTEEGLPFLILFHKPEDKETVKNYVQVVSTELQDVKDRINFLTADGLKFEHPLHHLGKKTSDLPLIAIDSFRHMYLYPDITRMTQPGSLRQFINDLHSGKLHREFHYGPDPEEATDPPVTVLADGSTVVSVEDDKSEKVPHKVAKRSPTTPPVSMFRNLLPSRNRYTILRDEL